jgi:hypothetical protein
MEFFINTAVRTSNPMYTSTLQVVSNILREIQTKQDDELRGLSLSELYYTIYYMWDP